jgi:hypothetical protein
MRLRGGPVARVYKEKVRAMINEILGDSKIIDPDWKGL